MLDLHDNMWLYSKRYRCNKCRKRWLGHDEAVMNMLPKYVRLQFPVVLRHQSALSSRLVKFIRRQLPAGQSLNDVVKSINESISSSYYHRMLMFEEHKKYVTECNRRGILAHFSSSKYNSDAHIIVF